MTNLSKPRTAYAVARGREAKAQAILKTIEHFVSFPLSQTLWLDIGCGNGGIAAQIAPQVKFITGIDPAPWPDWTDFQSTHSNLQLLSETIETLSGAENSMDIILRNQVYEHVPNPQYLIEEIYRMLKPGGYCYFAGPNLLFPIEPHVFWPLVHWLPRPVAVKLMQICGSKQVLDAESTTYWTLKQWLHRFEVTNAVPFIIKHPEIYGRDSWLKPFWLWQLLSYVPTSLLQAGTWLSPGLVFILKKPEWPVVPPR